MISWKYLACGGNGAYTFLGDLGLAIARIGAGAMLAVHGWGKIPVSEGFITGIAKMGFPAPTAFAWASALTEFAGAILLALGLMTRPVALALTFNMTVAAFIALKDAPWVTPMTGGPAKEMALLYLLIFLIFVFTGAGRFSADRVLRGT